ncbi:deubiquitinase OTUD6B-like isoform X2 [Uloborus diversus]|uniref:deubiquitinase OTUD6B-like isoform X2 n=1 Tax=Uloborus diversus TaxID=327109 RepID=UPI00240A0FE6|nr:deubiquitinase OTUD6B-like isoform X2 [Uloborus diversus]
MAENKSYEDIVANQRKEKKDLQALTQNMKHSVPKGDKKKKKEITAQIAQMLADLDLKHEEELKVFEAAASENIEKVEDFKDGNKESLSVEEPTKSNIDVTDEDDTDLATKVEPKQKLSKAQKRRNKKAEMERQRIKAIEEQEVANLSGMRNVEAEEIKQKLSDRKLIIHEIPSDGDCLYTAIAHQLAVSKLQQLTVKELREQTSKFLLCHKDDYIPFLTSSETGDVLSEDEYIKYCEDVANTSVWGGHVEIQALSNICGSPIEIIQATGPSVIIGEEMKNSRLIISYHKHIYGLGAHYNSVVPASSETTD